MSDSPWRHSDEETLRGLKKLFALVATEQYLSGKRTEVKLFRILQKMLDRPQDQQLFSKLAHRIASAKPAKRKQGKPPHPRSLVMFARNIAKLVLDDHPNASNAAIERTVYGFMRKADREGDFIPSKRTIESWLRPWLTEFKEKRPAKRQRPLVS